MARALALEPAILLLDVHAAADIEELLLPPSADRGFAQPGTGCASVRAHYGSESGRCGMFWGKARRGQPR
ncbi:hypothetical protein [uncultured Desulfovibrio sp.]|uniref:hypothetical protein n=1 Tax=uncultured Desulfovibrio sp. TaxID=167968 RepID=UPI0026392C04|nr:hypothetical protein [uncultured Desulfovibrio sp.]